MTKPRPRRDVLTAIGATFTTARANLTPFPSLNYSLEVHAVVSEEIGSHG
jgi:hypothetical protein